VRILLDEAVAQAIQAEAQHARNRGDREAALILRDAMTGGGSREEWLLHPRPERAGRPMIDPSLNAEQR